MNLRSVPDPVWYALLAAATAGGVYWLTRRAVGSVGEKVSQAGSWVNDAIIPGPDSLGTWLYGVFHMEENLPAGYSTPATLANGGGKGTRSAPAANLPGWAGGGAPAPSQSWTAPPSYDYGTSGTSGIPWRYESKPLPDPFNFSLDYIR
ncbi:hypothetical protein C3942_16910 [Solimonas fluminis]|uniref:Uncharacterized protein n=1 Tax=Solimonas fluminis TaxID=2086571 RepID=A0A2S5TCK2_9GAMM|nr:hypothetical protein [Solimonas fluminis]PPE72729.1 hypothetical protein C3942_16910 [Solimonas fluminis]